MAEKIFVTAVLTAADGKVDDLLSILRDLTIETRKEAGSIEYGFVQDSNNSNVILAREEWRDATSEAAHWETEHLKTALGKFDGILGAEPQIFKGYKVI